MILSIDLPTSLEESLRRDIADIDQVAKESLLVDLYRRQQISKHQLALGLGLDRFSVNDVLNRHHVTEDLPTAEEIHREVAAIEALLKQSE